ncbi:MAG: peroxiredoxin [Methylococcaceae bacterium]|nr:peroxiredoxin [Methylococcaceae bacterium]
MTKLGSISKAVLLLLVLFPFFPMAQADPLQVGQPAPRFRLHDQDGHETSLVSRQGKGWTVLYFYPKAGTPGCTTQACAFRDGIQSIRNLNAEVYGISTDDVEDLLKFHRKHKLNFTLLSDPEAEATQAYGVKLPLLNMAKRWTCIVDPDLVIRHIDDQVDPALDAGKVAEQLKGLQTFRSKDDKPLSAPDN